MEQCHDTILLLLTVSEDRATQRCDLSAGTEVSGKGDASSIALFLLEGCDAASSFLETLKR